MANAVAVTTREMEVRMDEERGDLRYVYFGEESSFFSLLIGPYMTVVIFKTQFDTSCFVLVVVETFL